MPTIIMRWRISRGIYFFRANLKKLRRLPSGSMRSTPQRPIPLSNERIAGVSGRLVGVLAVLIRRSLAGPFVKTQKPDCLYHLAGAAAAELGQPDVARKHWKAAVQWRSVAPWAQQNLDDLKRPIGEQNGPWAFRSSIGFRGQFLNA